MHIPNEIDYIEFCVSDMTKSKQFYATVFGWEFTDYSPTYAGIKGIKKEMGGFTVTEKIKSGGVLPVIYTDNLEATLSTVKKANSRVVKGIFSFPGGRRFEFIDPSGNILAVWSDQ